MEELKPTTGTSVTVPKEVKRYFIFYFTPRRGWEIYSSHYSAQIQATPETAQDAFLRDEWLQKADEQDRPTHYLVAEFTLPVIFTEPPKELK